MRRVIAKSFRSVLAERRIVRAAGAHDALSAILAQQAGFDAVWASGLGVSASCGLPDASLLTMRDYLAAAEAMQKRVSIPVVADCDSGFGDNRNVTYMVHEYEAAGITAVSIEDKEFPKMNSFVADRQTLLPASHFAARIETAKSAQASDEFFLIARTEALIGGLGIDDALRRAHLYADAGADGILVHSKAKTGAEVEKFLQAWDRPTPVIAIPTTYPDWSVKDAERAGTAMVIYANQGLRACVSALRGTYLAMAAQGSSASLEAGLAPLSEIFSLQRLAEWQQVRP
jgi:phosphoenolpyruvate phosphomutase